MIHLGVVQRKRSHFKEKISSILMAMKNKFFGATHITLSKSEHLVDFYCTSNKAQNMSSLALENNGEKPKDLRFAEIRKQWQTFLLGGELDLTNTNMRKYIDSIDIVANTYWQTLHTNSGRTLLWNDLVLSPFPLNDVSQAAKERSGNVAQTYYRLEALAKAYFTQGTSLYRNEAVKLEVIKALDFMYENYYNENIAKTDFYGNWWHWEIGAANSSLTTALLLFDSLSKEQVVNYVNAVSRYTAVADEPSGYLGSPMMTGANLIDKATAVALCGVLCENVFKLEHMKSAIKPVFNYVTVGDGFYQDGSFIQHQALAFIGGYGKDLYTKLGTLFVAFYKSDWDLIYDDHAEQMIFDMIFKAIEPFFYHGRFMDMVSGRDIVRNGASDRNRGVTIATAVLPMRSVIPTSQKRAFDAMMKAILFEIAEIFFEQCTNVTAVKTAIDLLEDSSVSNSINESKNFYFGGMDKYVYSNGSYALGLSMHSNRTYGHELINDEGKQTWNIANGATYIYTSDKNQFGNGYWATIDPTRIPGTTVEHVVHPKGAADRVKNVYNWVGGSILENYASMGMQYKALGTGGAFNGADVKKSWFMVGDEVIAIGSGITSTTGNIVETIIDNQKIQSDCSNQFVVDGVAQDIITSVNKATSFTNPQWMFLEGNMGDGTGYYFIDDIQVNVLKENRVGNWFNQGTTNVAADASYATIYIDHGINPKNAQYAYVVVPMVDKATIANRAKNSDIMLLSNTSDIHAVAKTTVGFIGANFWNLQGGSIAGIDTNAPASVSLVQKNGVVKVAVSDPTQTSESPIKVVINIPIKDVLKASSGITVRRNDGHVVLEVMTNGTLGQSQTVVFSYIEAELPFVESL